MSPTSVEQPLRPASCCPELTELAAAGLVPERADDTQANALLERDGAVILTGRTGEPVELVAAAAAVRGTRLRQLLPIPRQAADAAERLALHAEAPQCCRRTPGERQPSHAATPHPQPGLVSNRRSPDLRLLNRAQRAARRNTRNSQYR